MNWGGFAIGLSQGLDRGLDMGQKINNLIKQDKVDKVRAQGLAEAQAARAAAIDGAIQENKGAPTNPAATGGITGQPASEATATTKPELSPSVKPQASPTASPTYPMAEDPMTADKPIKPAMEDKPITRRRVLSEPEQKPAPQTAAPATPAQTGLPFVVGGKGYATREEARAAAEKAAPDMMSFMSKTLVPKMQQVYLEQGDMEKADAWGKWAEERDNKDAMREWAGAYRAAQIGNFDKAADHVFNLYKRYDDGITPLSKETVRDNQGNVTGFNVRLKRDATGEEYSQFIDKKQLTEMGLSALSPQAMFEAQFKRQQAADQAAATNAAKLAEEDRQFKRDIYKDDRNFGQQRELKRIDSQEQAARDARQQDNAIEKMTIEKQLDDAKASSRVRREVGAKVQALREAGYSDEFINGALPAILGVGDYKKATSPEEARRLAHSDRMKSDPMYSRKSAEDQKKILDQDMQLVFGGVKPTTPARSGLPAAPSAAAPSGKGTPVYDPTTGKIVYR